MNSQIWNQTLIDFSNAAASLGASLFVQSSLLLSTGLVAAWLCRRRGAAVQSLILRATLVAVFVCPLVSHLFGSLGIARASFSLPKATSLAIAGPVPAESLVTTSTAAPSPAFDRTASAPASTSAQSAGAGGLSSSTARNSSPGPLSTVEPLKASSRLGLLYVAFTLAWACGALLLLARLAVCHGRVGRLRWQARLADVPVFERCQTVARELGIEPPEILVHEGVHSPLLVGLFRPAVVLPAVAAPDALIASREVLVHELAHLGRGDCLWHSLSRLATALLFFQPLLWLVARRIEETAEEVCDNYVIERMPDRRAYARALVNLAELIELPRYEAVAGVGVIAFKSALGQRIVRILDAARELSVHTSVGTCAVTAILALTAASAIGLIVVASQGVAQAAASEGPTALRARPKVTTLFSWSNPVGDKEANGALAPDESMVIHDLWHERGIDLVVKDLATGATRTLVKAGTNEFEYSDAFVWTPDSKQVVFTWQGGKGGAELRMVSAAGGAARSLRKPGDGPVFYPFDVSPDGKEVLGGAWKSDNSMTLATVSVETGELRQLFSLEWKGTWHARYSPDGKLVVFDREVDGQSDVFLLDVGAGNLTRLTESPANDTKPVFSAGGGHVLFSSNRRGGNWDLMVLPVWEGRAAGEAFLVRHSFGDYDKRVTRTGKLVFTAHSFVRESYFAEIDPATGESRGTPRMIAKESTGANIRAVWSPDGSTLAYVRAEAAPLLVLQSVPDGKEELIATGMTYLNSGAFWHPDGKRLALLGIGPKGQRGIFLFTLKTRELKPLNLFGAVGSEPKGFSPDGREFIFFAFGTEGWKEKKEPIAIDVATGKERKIEFAANAGRVLHYDYSPDQKRIAYVSAGGSETNQVLIVADRDFGNKRTLVSGKTGLRYPRWSRDGTKIAYLADSGDENEAPLRVVAADGSWDKPVNVRPRRLWHTRPEWSGDSRRLAFTIMEGPFTEIMLLENFLPSDKHTAQLDTQEGGGMSLKIVFSDSIYALGTLSPDESQVAYIDLGDKAGDLMVKDLTSGRIQNVSQGETNAPGAYDLTWGYFIWSPDSTRLAYDWHPRSTNFELRVTTLAEGKHKVLKDHTSEIEFYPVDWSSDGSWLLCETVKKDSTRGLATVATQDGETRQLMSFDWTGAHHARFSPDGKFVVFDRTVEDNRDVWLLPLAGSQPTRLTDSFAKDGTPIFSPDGKMVLFSSDRRGSWDLWGLQLREGKPTGEAILVKPDFGDHAKRLTRQGKLAFLQSPESSDAYYVEINAAKGGTLGPPKLVTRSFFGRHLHPVWSSDGIKIASIRLPNLLCIQTVANAREEIVQTGMAYMNKLFWSPDGQWLALSPSGPKGQYGAFAYNLGTRELRPLYVKLGGQHRPKGWSPDGKEFFFKHDGEFKAVELATGNMRELFPGISEMIDTFDFSPDGKQIASVSKQPGTEKEVLVVADRAFREKRVLKAFEASKGHAGWPRWSPDGTMIAYYEWPGASPFAGGIELWVTAADGSWQKRVDKGQFKHWGNLKPPEWSPDSRKLGMTLWWPGRGELGLLENFMPKEKLAAK